MKFLLDTNTCIHVLRGQARVVARMRALRPEDIAVSMIVESELRVGALKSSSPAKGRAQVDALLNPLTVVEFTSDDAVVYAELRARLERAGQVIGPMDMLIAAQALQRKLTLVTANGREFSRVAGLDVENWAR